MERARQTQIDAMGGQALQYPSEWQFRIEQQVRERREEGITSFPFPIAYNEPAPTPLMITIDSISGLENQYDAQAEAARQNRLGTLHGSGAISRRTTLNHLGINSMDEMRARIQEHIRSIDISALMYESVRRNGEPGVMDIQNLTARPQVEEPKPIDIETTLPPKQRRIIV